MSVGYWRVERERHGTVEIQGQSGVPRAGEGGLIQRGARSRLRIAGGSRLDGRGGDAELAPQRLRGAEQPGRPVG